MAREKTAQKTAWLKKKALTRRQTYPLYAGHIALEDITNVVEPVVIIMQCFEDHTRHVLNGYDFTNACRNGDFLFKGLKTLRQIMTVLLANNRFRIYEAVSWLVRSENMSHVA